MGVNERSYVLLGKYMPTYLPTLLDCPTLLGLSVLGNGSRCLSPTCPPKAQSDC